MNFGFNSPGLEQLLTDLNRAGEKVGPAVREVVTKSALQVRKDARNAFDDQRVGNYAPLYSQQITYDLDTTGHTTTAEIGPLMSAKGSKLQGNLGEVFEYGTPTSPAMPHLNPALDAEEDPFVFHLAAAAVGVLRS